MREWLTNEIKNNTNFKNPDELIEAFFKYTKIKEQLENSHNKKNTKFYRNKEIIKQKLTYIWDGCSFMDDLLKGQIPKNLVNIFYKFQIRKRKKDIEELITEWANKCHRFF